MSDLSRSQGRVLFGIDASSYAGVRPPYPEEVFDLLQTRCRLDRVLDIGAGNGLASRPLLKRGAHLVALEPDDRFSNQLQALHREFNGRLEPLFEDFESASLPDNAFDLVICATSMHWLEPASLPKLGQVLKTSGLLAAVWNIFGDPRQADPFHEATDAILSSLTQSPSHPVSFRHPFGMDRDARRRDFEAAGACHNFEAHEFSWLLTLDIESMRALYATYASIAVLPEAKRENLLDEVAAIAEKEFDGVVERKMVTTLYLGEKH